MTFLFQLRSFVRIAELELRSDISHGTDEGKRTALVELERYRERRLKLVTKEKRLAS